ncbi:twin-arginine translocase subunit TatB [Sphingomonas sp.]|uniref:twin-arginine translocase subunit TatB n=1 Tax=Sphingomonas sp. TaxID=28214 RepID=UPI003B3B29A3
MFDVAPTELLVIAAVAVAVIPSKDLPKAMRFAGQWIGKARGMARHFRSGVDEMIRQAELEEMEKKWREENERIMREHPLRETIEHAGEPVMTPLPAPDPVVHTEAPASDTTTSQVHAGLGHDGDGQRGPELPLNLPPAGKPAA